jgi:hypothetical protein
MFLVLFNNGVTIIRMLSGWLTRDVATYSLLHFVVVFLPVPPQQGFLVLFALPVHVVVVVLLVPPQRGVVVCSPFVVVVRECHHRLRCSHSRFF